MENTRKYSSFVHELYKKGHDLCNNGNYSEGINLFIEVLRLHTDCFEAYMSIGNAYQDMDNC